MTNNCMGDQSQARGCGNWSPNELASTQEKDPSGGDWREPQKPDLWQIPPCTPGQSKWDRSYLSDNFEGTHIPGTECTAR